MDDDQPAPCAQYVKTEIPPADLPATADRPALASCNSEDLYFGFDHPANPAEARKCAYLEREAGKTVPDVVFGGSSLLAMIYANGKGAARNFDLALRFACESGWSPAEKQGRFAHLLSLKQELWAGDDFNLCDDATSGFMQGWCASLQEKFDVVARTRKLNSIIDKWNPDERTAFKELQQAAAAFFDASSQYEVDLSGTGRAAFEIEAHAALDEDFVSAVERFELGHLPTFSPDEFRQSDAKLNSVYAKIQATKPASEPIGSVTPEGVKTTERLWLRYREAWVAFGQVKFPRVTKESWRTWLTEQRVKMLQALQ